MKRRKRSAPWGKMAAIGSCLLLILVVSGCASTKVSNRQQLVTGHLPRPGNILVYDFAASPADVPPDSALAQQYSLASTPQTPAQIAEGRQLGAEIAAQLAEQIRAMGMPAEEVSAGAQPQINDIVIRGYLLSVQQGSTARRFVIGFGAGSSELQTVVEGYQMTPHGLRELGSGTIEANGSKTPGTAVGAATMLATSNPAGLIISGGMKILGDVSGRSKLEGRAKATAKEIAAVLKKRFQQQGWIY